MKKKRTQLKLIKKQENNVLLVVTGRSTLGFHFLHKSSRFSASNRRKGKRFCTGNFWAIKFVSIIKRQRVSFVGLWIPRDRPKARDSDWLLMMEKSS
ncbi:ankyrin repeat-containing protein [Gossypium australe]|uniref:Ankyrin repeat-containing protein n=1 Tax=Gossypium australe TaxID=47621 RepID=A0A5B6V6Z1_9ROSI|nr:ankyrin repeat-containing protein [Gossypium australe]